MLLNSLEQRFREAEIQDQADLDEKLLHQALRGLRSVNFVSGSYWPLWSAIRRLAHELGTKQLSVLDIAMGAGDIPIALWQRSQREGLQLEIQGCDVNPRTVVYAQELADRSRAGVRFFTMDALQDDFPRRYDVVTSSLFLHHLSDQEAVRLLMRMSVNARHMVLVNDLLRGMTGLTLAYLGTRLLCTSRVNRVDSLRSVRAAFTLEEAKTLAQQAGLSGVSFRRIWPCRFVLTWRRF